MEEDTMGNKEDTKRIVGIKTKQYFKGKLEMLGK